MATPLSHRTEPDDEPSQAVLADPAATEYQLPATRQGIAAQGAATLGLLTGLWVNAIIRARSASGRRWTSPRTRLGIQFHASWL